ncbi:uncharacterized protein, partial [Brachyistius frenatus]|uniref:uncharacterized protein n=1 Tax=Brachyistius frenatus TaxID=100188 RepID=UPI0037E8F915
SGYWKKGNKFISSNLPLKPDKEYDQRTKILGDLKSGNCTMLMSDVRVTDIGPFYFKVIIPGYEHFSFENNPVSINVTRIPDPPSLTVLVGKKVSASCSVIHSCPTMPPRITWNHAGAIKRRLKKLDQWKWESVTTLIFRPAASDFNKPLKCTVIYNGGKRAMSSTILKRLNKNWRWTVPQVPQIHSDMKGFRVMELKLWLSFLKLSIMHVAHDVQAIDWSVDIPSTIPAVEGSCLVIPCTYTYPSDRFKTSLPPLNGYWKKGKKIISSNLPLKLDKEYDQRTKLLGDLKSGNCTMLMSDVRATDIGPFHFRIVI